MRPSDYLFEEVRKLRLLEDAAESDDFGEAFRDVVDFVGVRIQAAVQAEFSRLRKLLRAAAHSE